MFEYDCPHCDKVLKGGFGDDVYCNICNKTYETDWDYISEDSMGAWLTGKEYDGNTNNDLTEQQTEGK